MKRPLLILLFLVMPLLLRAQLSGNGTFADPWSGTLSGDATWSGTKYINGDITVDNEKLTISAGAVIVFLAESADLIITGTGQLEANGIPGSQILFTADDDNDGNRGETGENWGHISFQSMGSAGSSLIDNCIIEFGYKNDPNPGLESFGGGLYAGLTNLMISDCTFRYNLAGYGGAIFIKDGCSPEILRCKIINNSATAGGGGLFVHSNVKSVISNCIISNNSCSGAGGGGGIYLGPYVENTIIVNSTIANNSAVHKKAGVNISFINNTLVLKPLFLNSIIWGSDNSIAYANQTPATDDFENCAIQNPVPGSTTNCITLNSSNTSSSGPNFVATDGSNWLIQPWSPCVNSGNGLDPNVPSSDFTGNSRIGQVDIGAYESQFHTWQGDDTYTPDSWLVADNWNSNSIPSSNSSIYIPSGLLHYPTNTSPDFTISLGNQMIIKPGAKATLGTLINNGVLTLESDASNISTLIINSFSGNNATVQLYLTGGGTKTTYKWHYISTPVTSLPVSVFTPVTPDIVRYYDSRVTTDLVQGWVAQDGWIYATGSFGGPTFTTLTPGRGYDFYDSANNTFTFSGQLNTADVPMALEFAGGANNGFNLLGNPFSSGLDWDYIISQPGYPTNTSKGLYFTRDNTLCSYIAGVGTPSDVNGYIPPMQGFFTKTYATGKTITLAAAAKTHSAHARYKGSGTIPLVRLSLADDTLSDETVVRFDEKASVSLDYDYDALKIFYSTENTAIYSVSDGSKYVINGQPFPDTTVSIPVGINILASGIHTISTTQLQGLDTYGVYLKDNVTGFTADLKTNPVVTFTASAGSIADRFILKVSNYTTGIHETNMSKTLFNIYHGFGSVNIQPLADEWDGIMGSATVFDMTGRKVTELRNAEFVKNSIIQLPSPDIKGVYIVQLKSGMKRYTGKVVIK